MIAAESRFVVGGGGKRAVFIALLLVSLAVMFLGVGFRSLGLWVATGAASPIRADVIVALGGGDGHRIRKVAEVFRAGYANTVLITGIEWSAERERAYYLNWRVRVLADSGVTADRIVIESTASNSFQEAQATLALLQVRGWKKALVVSDPPHMRRLDWVWRKVFAETGKSYVLVASEPAWWDQEHWWASEKSAPFVLTELVKLAYYLVKY
jgi:uncharacterized SAM-binding protein YcdF (DUF218 family)